MCYIHIYLWLNKWMTVDYDDVGAKSEEKNAMSFGH